MEEAHLRDLDELLKIERECFTKDAFTKGHMEVLLRNPNAVCLLAKIDGEIVGFIIGVIENHGAKRFGHIYTVDVAARYGRMGVGVKLLKEIENIFQKRRVEASILEVRVGNQAATRLYRKQGYVEIESLDDYYSRGVHGLRLKKQLKPGRDLSFFLL